MSFAGVVLWSRAQRPEDGRAGKRRKKGTVLCTRAKVTNVTPWSLAGSRPWGTPTKRRTIIMIKKS
jgi:hypothetical protein